MTDDGDLTVRLNGLREVLSNQIAAVETLCIARMDGQDAARKQYLTMLGDERAWLDRRIQAVKERAEGLDAAMQRQVDQRIGALTDAGQRQHTDLRAMLDERYLTQTKALDAAFKAAEQAVQTALVSAEKAVGKAEIAADKRFDSVNEFRQTLADQNATFMPRAEYDAGHQAVSDRIAANAERLAALELRLTSRLDRGEGAEAGVQGQRTEQRLNISTVIAVATLVLATVTFFILYATKR